ncbi:hypothetical protein JCM10914_6457 [Paenibacillus sp. JCM 10914]|nr:hypothetical protein JCM10914_6457 [Paenibacillus sp. JCM 10914]
MDEQAPNYSGDFAAYLRSANKTRGHSFLENTRNGRFSGKFEDREELAITGILHQRLWSDGSNNLYDFLESA